ncbi:AVAST type 1 anti-phage system protease Avs1b [Janthinobacterium aestuarii]
MIEQYYRDAVCQIRCGEEQGTGFLVSEGLILTARHCVVDALAGDPITVSFPNDAEPFQLSATVVDDSEEFDVCLLSVELAVTRSIVKLRDGVCREGLHWETYGYPAQRASMGHVLAGTVSQVHSVPRLRIDVDLIVEANRQLRDYGGASGAPLMLDGECLGIVRLSLDGSLGAISTAQIKEFLLRNSVSFVAVGEAASQSSVVARQAPRDEFTELFELKIKEASGEYIFLEGAHGIGKTTFCRSFQPDEQSLEVLGVYSFGESVYGSAHRVQPETFVDWLSTQISREMTSRVAAKESFTSYADVIERAVKLFEQYARHCMSRGKQGVLFIDGLNEANFLSPDLFRQFLGLLPSKLPIGISVILSAPNYEQLAVHLGQRIAAASRVALPVLSDEVVRRYCMIELSPELATPLFVASICKRAKGHPLYLRYLIEYANDSPSEAQLDDFPEYSGSIEAYYQVIWAQLSSDPNAVQLLALLCRLRWGVPISDLPEVLTDVENSVFLATLPRIRHLLKSRTESTIYHSSFAEFLSNQTVEIANQIHGRLARYCESFSTREYCVINTVFHYLRAGKENGSHAVACCSQDWVDKCVTLGFDADSLLYDIEGGLEAAVNVSTMPEVVRLLLLLQRLGFRYNTLFAQSATLVSEALISLDRPQVALRHAVRFGTLIVPIDESLRIAYNLAQAGNQDEALELLGMVFDAISIAMERKGNTIAQFVEQSCLLFKCLYFMYLADGNFRMQQMHRALYRTVKTVEASLEGAPPSDVQNVLIKVQSTFLALPICFTDRFSSFVELSQQFPKFTQSVVSLWTHVVFNCDEWVREFSMQPPTEALKQIFVEMEAQLTSGDKIDAMLVPDLLDTLIRFNAPTSLTVAVAGTLKELDPGSITVTGEDRVEIDYQTWHQGCQVWRLSAYLKRSKCPSVSVATASTWYTTISELSAAISWCEGAARRANAENDQVMREAVLKQLRENIVEQLTFSLVQRVSWEDGYAIPESIIPYIYGRLADLYLACFPEHSMELVASLKSRFKDQCGLYSEGFRLALAQVVTPYLKQSLSDNDADQLFELLELWRNYILSNVENRYELVPELLSIIPLLVTVDAKEVAQAAFQNMLDVSMGPGWYKEDQIGIVNTVVSSIPSTTQVSTLLPKIAGLLEAASGEMTFQRYVRVEKSSFIAELWRRGLFIQAMSYFKRQLCGAPSELFEDATYGDIDRPEQLKGMRFPGCAIDEQDAVCQIVGNSESVDWRLRWAILDTYVFGDDRHSRRYAKLYAQIFNAFSADVESLASMVERLKVTVDAELSDSQKIEFSVGFFDTLLPALRDKFVDTTLYSALPKAQELPKAHEAEAKPERNSDEILFQPGLFGRQSSREEADALIAGLERNSRRGNHVEAKKTAVELLSILQSGGWNIWANDTGAAHSAKEILRKQESSADAVTRYYGVLITSEVHVARWRIAEFLIKNFTCLLAEPEQLDLAEIVIDHVQRMVGQADVRTKKFEFISNAHTSTANKELRKLLLWTVDHPRWQRRDTAADMLLQLVQEDDLSLTTCLDEALTSQPFNGSEVMFGILDIMSATDPLSTWKKLTESVAVSVLAESYSHLSRLAVLHRIATRAAKSGDVEAAQVLDTLSSRLGGGRAETQSDSSDWPPAWAQKLPWEKISVLTPLSAKLKTTFVDEVTNICLPHSIETVWELEKLVAQGFREGFGETHDRWDSKLRFALNLAIFKCGTNHPEDLERQLRAFNPSRLYLNRQVNVSSLGRKILAERNMSIRRKNAMGDGQFINIHYTELFELGNNLYEIEILAILTSAFNGYEPILPSEVVKFDSTETPAININADANNTCCFVVPRRAFFGVFTPAVPTVSFKKIISANDSDFKRINWKSGRPESYIKRAHFNTQGAALSIRRGALRLPPGYRLAWIVKIDGKIVDAF